MMLWMPLILKWIKFDAFRCRSLTQGEITLSQSVFGDLIDYDSVKIMNHPFLPWQPSAVFMAPKGYLHIRNKHFKTDYSKENKIYQGIFIHEMTHILQHQQGQNVLLKGAFLQSAYFISFKKYNPYAYKFDPKKNFNEYNIEQQGEIARDIFLKKIPNIILNQ